MLGLATRMSGTISVRYLLSLVKRRRCASAAYRSRRDASFALLEVIAASAIEISVSVPLVLEYEAVACRQRTSDSPLVRALAVIDRRVGKRRLQAFAVDAEQPFVTAP